MFFWKEGESSAARGANPLRTEHLHWTSGQEDAILRTVCLGEGAGTGARSLWVEK